MTGKQVSPIKLADILSQSKEVDVMSTFIINEEKNQVVHYNKYFDKSQVENLVKELFADMKYALDNNYDFFVNEEQLIKYELLLIIKHFSHFKHEIGESFDEKILAMEALMKIGLYDLFFDEIFDQDQVADIVNQINMIAEKVITTQDIVEKVLDKKDK